MNTIKINGLNFTDLGQRDETCGMRLISLYPMPNNFISDILAGKYPNIWLNPATKCTNSEFFGVFGTEKQYTEFYGAQKESVIACRVQCKLKTLFPKLTFAQIQWDKFRKENEYQHNIYRDWWEG